MKKLKKTRHNEIIVKLEKYQNVNRNEVNIVSSDRCSCFVHLDVRENKSAPSIVYSVEGMIDMNEFLSMTVLSKRLFLHILRQYVKLEKVLKSRHLNRSLVIYKSEFVFINPQNLNVSFIYVPVQPIDISGTYREVLKELIKNASFSQNESLEYVHEFIKRITDESCFSLVSVETYIELYDNDLNVSLKKTCIKCGYNLDNSDSVCPMCGMKFDDYLVCENSYEMGLASNCTAKDYCSHNEEDNGIISYFKIPSSVKMRFRLENLNCSVQVKRTPFRLGKQVDIVDFCIKNSAVSRRHAEISEIDGQYYISDLDSTNGTFVNGNRILPDKCVALHNGDVVAFANSIFNVIIEEV